MLRRGVYGRRNIGQVRKAVMLANGTGHKNEATAKTENVTIEKPEKKRCCQ